MLGKDCFLVVLLGLVLGCGVVLGHGHGEGELHEQVYVQDSREELERKWSFEVSCYIFFFGFFGGF